MMKYATPSRMMDSVFPDVLNTASKYMQNIKTSKRSIVWNFLSLTSAIAATFTL